MLRLLPMATFHALPRRSAFVTTSQTLSRDMLALPSSNSLIVKAIGVYRQLISISGPRFGTRRAEHVAESWRIVRGRCPTPPGTSQLKSLYHERLSPNSSQSRQVERVLRAPEIVLQIH
jgi:hypothetical protein